MQTSSDLDSVTYFSPRLKNSDCYNPEKEKRKTKSARLTHFLEKGKAAQRIEDKNIETKLDTSYWNC